jgi:hypothetical protein
MYKKPSKKRLLIQRTLLSTAASLLVIFTVTISIFFMLGYRLDSGNGRIEQGALLQFDSTPNGADVWVDGKLVNGRTATKQTVVAGTHSVRMSRSGYEDWNRTLDLASGTLTWLDYTRLVPTQRTPQTVSTYPALVSLQFSPDNRWALAQEKADTPAFHLVDLRAEEVKSTLITIPSELITDATTADVTHAYSLHEWSEGGRYALVRHTYNDKSEWLIVDTQDRTKDKNVTRTLSIDLSDVKFAGTNGSTLYGLTVDGVIRKLDVNGSTLSGGLVSSVRSFEVYDTSVISYVGADPAAADTQLVGIYRDGDEAPHVLRRGVAKDTPLSIAVTKYFSNDYVAIGEGSAVTILRGSYPGSSDEDSSSLKKFATLDLAAAISDLSFSPSGDYLVAQSGATFTSYELEHRRSANGSFTVAEGAGPTQLRWLDNAHLWNDDAGSLVMRDFNGLNAHTIMQVVPGFDTSLSQNGRFFYGVHRTGETYALQRVKMILD